MSKFPRYLNRLPDAGRGQWVCEMYEQFIATGERPLDQLVTEFYPCFGHLDGVVLRKQCPRGLNSQGENAVRMYKLWILWVFVMYLDSGATGKELIRVTREGLLIVENPAKLIEGLGELLERCPDIEIDEDDEIAIHHLIGSRHTPGLQAVTHCGRFALVELTPEEQRLLTSKLAVVPVENNLWVKEVPCKSKASLETLLQRSGYTYHPCPNRVIN